MKVLITDDDRFQVVSADTPVIGRYYMMEDAETGTGAQNRAFHALVGEYFKSGCYSDTAHTVGELKDKIKLRLGEGFEAFVYIDPDDPYHINDCKKYEDIPESIRKSDYRRELIRGRLKSFSDYTLKQRKNIIDRLVSEMETVGVNSKKYREIIEGMQNDK